MENQLNLNYLLFNIIFNILRISWFSLYELLTCVTYVRFKTYPKYINHLINLSRHLLYGTT
jgi:hypothetical protein